MGNVSSDGNVKILNILYFGNYASNYQKYFEVIGCTFLTVFYQRGTPLLRFFKTDQIMYN
jgi:hypothetical protein